MPRSRDNQIKTKVVQGENPMKKTEILRHEIWKLRKKYIDFQSMENDILKVAREVTGGRLEEAYKIVVYNNKIADIQEILGEKEKEILDLKDELSNTRNSLAVLEEEQNKSQKIESEPQGTKTDKITFRYEMKELINKYPNARNYQHEIIILSQQIIHGDLETAYKVFAFDNLQKLQQVNKDSDRDKDSISPGLKEKETDKEGEKVYQNPWGSTKTSCYQVVGKEFIPADKVLEYKSTDYYFIGDTKEVHGENSIESCERDYLEDDSVDGMAKYWYGTVDGDQENVEDLNPSHLAKVYQGQAKLINEFIEDEKENKKA
jgi:hypothetical protein